MQKIRPARQRYALIMQVGVVGTRHAACLDWNESVEAASCAMRAQRVDQVVVTKHENGARVPLGVISARDIVTRVVALGLDSSVLKAGDLVWSPAAQASITDTVPEALDRLSATGGEALAVVDSEGQLMGVVCLDDLLQALAGSESSGTHRIHR
jgi:CBS domain-containing protein